MIATRQAQQERLHELRTEIDKLDYFVNATNKPEYDLLARNHKAALNQRLKALRDLAIVLNQELEFLN